MLSVFVKVTFSSGIAISDKSSSPNPNIFIAVETSRIISSFKESHPLNSSPSVKLISPVNSTSLRELLEPNKYDADVLSLSAPINSARNSSSEVQPSNEDSPKLSKFSSFLKSILPSEEQPANARFPTVLTLVPTVKLFSEEQPSKVESFIAVIAPVQAKLFKDEQSLNAYAPIEFTLEERKFFNSVNPVAP